MSTTVSKREDRNYALDLLRFIAAFAVVIFHYTYRGYMADNLNPVSYPWLGSICKYGYLGVHLFFVISGYVVLMSAMGKTVWQFFFSRFTRLYPAFWVACTLTFLAIRFLGPVADSPFRTHLMDASLTQYIVNMTMLQQFFGFRDLDGVYWTLTVEISFYFLISLLIAYKLVDYMQWILMGWLFYSLLAGSTPAPSVFSFAFFPQFAPLFIGGMLLYLRKIGFTQRWKLHILLLVALGLALRNGIAASVGLGVAFHDQFSPVIVGSIIVAIFAVLLLITDGHITLKRFNGLGTLGALTYPVYLLHHNIGYIFYQRLHTISNKYVLLVGLTIASFIAAYLVHVLVEKRYARALGQQVDAFLKKFTPASSKA
ncbi:acyltransferase family protein [Hymenobacter sp. AT01-02]|uniref:acyltransferase family protein n=1 Tax=Hymenobacter sp. AT01-02 TaxID=1571877 RepID=UPI0005F17324|nr:acyltransferase [Hymenobacter sp. AT01-02]